MGLDRLVLLDVMMDEVDDGALREAEGTTESILEGEID